MLDFSTESTLSGGFLIASGNIDDILIDGPEKEGAILPISFDIVNEKGKPDPYRTALLNAARLPGDDDAKRFSRVDPLLSDILGEPDPDFAKHFLSILQHSSSPSWTLYAVMVFPDCCLLLYAGSSIEAVIVENFSGTLALHVPATNPFDTSIGDVMVNFNRDQLPYYGCMANISFKNNMYRLRFRNPKTPRYNKCLIKVRHAIPLN